MVARWPLRLTLSPPTPPGEEHPGGGPRDDRAAVAAVQRRQVRVLGAAQRLAQRQRAGGLREVLSKGEGKNKGAVFLDQDLSESVHRPEVLPDHRVIALYSVPGSLPLMGSLRPACPSL
jgi:hypothetical protein